MPKKFILSMIGFLLLIFISTGCNKFLDRQPVTTSTDQTTWKTAADAMASVNACYAYLRSVLNSTYDYRYNFAYYCYGDIASDEFSSILDYDFDQIRQVNWGNGMGPFAFDNPQLALRRYDKFYQTIAQANRCLYFIPNMPLSAFEGEDSLSQKFNQRSILAEALFIRAFTYFYISRVWGDVPLVSEYKVNISSDTGISRTAQETVLSSCIRDINEAVKYLPQDQNGDFKGIRASKSAAYALLAHIYAWKGNYDSCYTSCKNVINNTSSRFLSRTDYNNIFKGSSDESIFEIAQNLEAEGTTAGIGSQTLMNPYNNNTQPSWVNNNTHFFNLFDTLKDLRYKNAFAYTLPPSSTNGILSCTKYSHLKKLTSGTAVFYEYLSNIIIFRYTDIYLLMAEAAAAKSAPDFQEALGYLNNVRQINGLPQLPGGLSGINLINEIFDERGRELFLEGHRFYDLVRQMRLTKVNHFPNINDIDFSKGKYYWPIDPTLYVTNKKLKQTPFWASILTH